MLLSVVVANVVIPIWAARESTWRRAVQKTVLSMLVFNAAYAAILRYL